MQTDADFLCIPITKEMKSRASRRAKSLGVLKNSITKGDGNLAAYLAEDAIKVYLGGSYPQGEAKYNHDVVVNGYMIEVKAKRRKTKPKLEYEVSIAKSSTHQNPDFYIFASVDEENVWLVGYISREEFFSRANFVKKGSIDQSNFFRCHRDMYNMVHSDLYPISGIVNVLVSDKKS